MLAPWPLAWQQGQFIFNERLVTELQKRSGSRVSSLDRLWFTLQTGPILPGYLIFLLAIDDADPF